MDIVVCGDRHMVTGFRLAGIRRAYEIQEAKKRLSALLADSSVGVIIMTERFAEEHHDIIEAHRSARRTAPVVVAVPDMSGPITGAADPIRALIKKAIGADLHRVDDAK